MRTTTVVLGALGAFAALARANDGGNDAPTRELGTVTVTATRPTSLPTQIPTTIEGISGDQVAETINATDSEDALKYFPSLLVRKRYIGDYDHAVLATRASGSGNSARSLVYADGILLSNLLGNGAGFTPRWGLVAPEEIERIDVLYGPFSAAYSGNSAGAIVDFVTRMPTRFEAHAKLQGFAQPYRLYGTDDTYSGGQSADNGREFGDVGLSGAHVRSCRRPVCRRRASRDEPCGWDVYSSNEHRREPNASCCVTDLGCFRSLR